MRLRSVFRIGIILALSLSLNAQPALATMSSTNYQIGWDSVGVGGADTASSATYKLRDSLGFLTGSATSTSYDLDAGYRVGIYDRIASFAVMAQFRASAVAATSATTTTVTVTNSSGFSAGDYIMLVQDEGVSQVANMARILSVSSPVLTIDAFNGPSITIDGSNDLVYELSGTSLDLGTLTSSAVTTTTIGWDVTADVSQGYSVYVVEDHDLRNSDLTAISDVTDGEVTASDGEYGARSSDTSLTASTFDTADTAITTTLQQVASRTDNSFSSRDYLTLKVASESGQAGGTYTQTISLIYVGDY